MTKQQFYAEMENILELDPGTIKGTELLSEFESWDSLAMLSFIAMADSTLRTLVPPGALKKCLTVADLIGLFPAGISEA